MNFDEKIRLLPESPGVYRFLNEEGVVIYVGKAKNLKRRVAQYFQATRQHSRKTAVMVSHIVEIQHTVVDSEQDALLLENNLIKQFQPKYNILLKDGKTYPWICVRNELFPRVFMTRRFVRDGSLYFGPYGSVHHARQLLDLINSLYQLRTCKHKFTEVAIEKGAYRVCLDYHIKRCKGPCIGAISQAAYAEQLEGIKDLLRGNTGSLIRSLERKMKAAAAELRFEEAQACLEKKTLLEQHYSRSIVANSQRIDADVFSLVFEGNEAFGNFMRLRDGAIVQSLNMELRLRIEEEQECVLGVFMQAIYDQLSAVEGGKGRGPEEVIVPFLPDREFEGRKLHIPLRGDKVALLELSRKNAAALRHERLRKEEFANPQQHTDRILDRVRQDLGMEVRPEHIECFDNSNLQGTNPVSACVVFRNAAPARSDYRIFHVKTVVGANDYATMKEVVNRRYSRLLREEKPLPQLIVIDGGKGQVGAAIDALCELGIYPRIKVVGLAERMEEIIIPGQMDSLLLDKNSSTLRLLMHLRDEAHRFGITHHRNRRSASQLHSELDDIPGIGPKRIEQLLQAFKSVKRIREAGYEAWEATIGKKGAQALQAYYREKLNKN